VVEEAEVVLPVDEEGVHQVVEEDFEVKAETEAREGVGVSALILGVFPLYDPNTTVARSRPAPPRILPRSFLAVGWEDLSTYTAPAVVAVHPLCRIQHRDRVRMGSAEPLLPLEHACLWWAKGKVPWAPPAPVRPLGQLAFSRMPK
jgi:hypothetical protein